MLKKVAVLLMMVGIAFVGLKISATKVRFDVQNCMDLKGTPGEFWQVLTDAEGWKHWWPGVLEARIEPGWQQGAQLNVSLIGESQAQPATVTAVVPMMTLAWEKPGLMGSTLGTQLELGSSSAGSSLCFSTRVVGPQAVLAGVTGRDEFEQYHKKVLAQAGLHVLRGGH